MSTSNTANVPESRKALDDMKYEVAKELGIPMNKDYNGHLTARENGYVGGEMVRRMIRDYEKSHAGE